VFEDRMPWTHDRVAGRTAPRACPQARLPPRDRPGPRAAVAPALPAPAPRVFAPASARAVVLACAAFAACFGYAFLRYVVHKGEPLTSVPLYVTNKAAAVFAVLALGAAAARPRAAWRRFARGAGLAAGALHSAASLALLRPAYYAKLFQPGADARLTGAGEGALLCGAVALVIFGALRLARPPPGWPRGAARLAALLGLATAALHCLLLAGAKAFDVAGWPGGLPPMSLVAASAAVIGLGVAVVARRGRG
jgi:hypothetical protein